MEKKKLICSIAADKANIASGINQSAWDSVELNYYEKRSTEKIKEMPLEEGFELESGLAGVATSFAGWYGSGKPVIGVLMEHDALPDLSQEVGAAKSYPVKGKECGRGYGHSALGAGAVGTAIAMKECLRQTGQIGTVELYEYPAEETGFSRTFIVKAHCFGDLDMTFYWHPTNGNMSMSVRTVAHYKARFDFKGRTSYVGVAPELGRSVLNVCELMDVGVNYLKERIMSNVRVYYAYIDRGGKAPNVAPDHASLLYFVRAPKLKQNGEILERIKKVAQGAVLMTEMEVEIQVLGGMNDTISNPVTSKLLAGSFVETGAPGFGEEESAIARKFLDITPEGQKARAIAGGTKRSGISPEESTRRPLDTFIVPYTDAMRDRVMTSSGDVGDMNYQVPAAQITAAVGVSETGAHTRQMTTQMGTFIGDKVNLAVAKAIVLTCAKIYEKSAIVEQAKKELLEETGGVYIFPIPDRIVPADVE